MPELRATSPAELVAGIAEVMAKGGARSAAMTAALSGRMTDNPPTTICTDLLYRSQRTHASEAGGARGRASRSS